MKSNLERIGKDWMQFVFQIGGPIELQITPNARTYPDERSQLMELGSTQFRQNKFSVNDRDSNNDMQDWDKFGRVKGVF